ncbi:MAG TPA: GNAT family N-acetyltransferase [Vicinamibacterales bacterium]|nr:GNAT family N-acetyltransferase [Vicinamibacterales bacterium]
MGVPHNLPPASIRRATPEDAAAVLRCLAEAFEPFRNQYSREGFEDTTLTESTIAARLSSMDVFVAEIAAGVVGTIATSVVSPDEGHLRGMAVLPDWQGHGIAEQLLDFAESHLRKLGCARVTLDTTVPLQRAIRFYEKHGYRATGKVGDFYGMPLYEYAKRL